MSTESFISAACHPIPVPADNFRFADNPSISKPFVVLPELSDQDCYFPVGLPGVDWNPPKSLRPSGSVTMRALATLARCFEL
jgi:hypothetical protein